MTQIQPQSQQQTIQQRRATDAYNRVQQVVNLREDKVKKEYGSLVRGLPAMILTDGLGQALAFLLAKAKGEKNAHGYAYEHLSSWVCGWAAQTEGHLMEHILSKSSNDYRQYTSESLAYLQWLKRFAEAANLQDKE